MSKNQGQGPELANLFALGFQNWMRYGSDPVNFVSGNFVNEERLFTVPGPGGADTPVTLTYNSLDPRKGGYGFGWSGDGVGGTTRYQDESVAVRLVDGQTLAFKQEGGGFVSVQGMPDRLTRDGRTLTLTRGDGWVYMFSEDDLGVGVLTKRVNSLGQSWVYKYADGSTTVPGRSNPWPVAPDGTSAGTAIPPV